MSDEDSHVPCTSALSWDGYGLSRPGTQSSASCSRRGGRLYACSWEEPTVARTNREIAVRPAVVVGIWHRDPASPASEL